MKEIRRKGLGWDSARTVGHGKPCNCYVKTCRSIQCKHEYLADGCCFVASRSSCRWIPTMLPNLAPTLNTSSATNVHHLAALEQDVEVDDESEGDFAAENDGAIIDNESDDPAADSVTNVTS
jgi:hypothetical protein